MPHRRLYARPPPRLVGMEVLLTRPHAMAAVKGARAAEQQGLEFWAAIIPPIAPAALAGHPALLAAARHRAGRAHGHSRSDKQCRSDEARRESGAVDLAAQRRGVDKGGASVT